LFDFEVVRVVGTMMNFGLAYLTEKERKECFFCLSFQCTIPKLDFRFLSPSLQSWRGSSAEENPLQL